VCDSYQELLRFFQKNLWKMQKQPSMRLHSSLGVEGRSIACVFSLYYLYFDVVSVFRRQIFLRMFFVGQLGVCIFKLVVLLVRGKFWEVGDPIMKGVLIGLAAALGCISHIISTLVLLTLPLAWHILCVCSF
jgi:hypothetical protein